MAEADSFPMSNPKILLVVGGGIAAYKACELVRTIRKAGGDVTCVLTESGAKFVTPMALAALSENPVHTTLWDLKNEVEMGHIELSREADLVVVCPATANLLAKMASGIADDLATTLLLATDKPVVAIPAMNVRMWEHASTVRNVATLREAGVDVMDPDEGEMACGEFGPGRLPEPPAIWERIGWALGLDPSEYALVQGNDAVPGLPQPDAPVQDVADSAELAPSTDAPVVEEPVTALEPAPEIEPDPDPEPEPEHADLGGLSSSLISRGIQKAKAAIGLSDHPAADEAIQSEEIPVPDEAPAPDETVVEEALAPDEAPVPAEEAPVPEEIEPPEVAPDEMPPAALEGGPLLSRKGQARAAPPTDPAALKHLISGNDGDAPQPVEGEAPDAFPDAGQAELPATAAPEVVPDAENEAEDLAEADPLDGQPDFEIEPEHRPLYGKHVLITAGPTWEPIDPVRYIANRSSGRQGFALAAAAAAAGARVTLVSGPVWLDTPPGVDRIDVESAVEMSEEVKKALPADIAIMVAAVADWRVQSVAEEKQKKRGSAPPALLLTENPDILAGVASSRERAQAADRFCGRDQRRDRPCQGQAQAQGRGLDHCQ